MNPECNTSDFFSSLYQLLNVFVTGENDDFLP